MSTRGGGDPQQVSREDREWNLLPSLLVPPSNSTTSTIGAARRALKALVDAAVGNFFSLCAGWIGRSDEGFGESESVGKFPF